MINDAKENLKAVKNVLVDGGYSGEKFSSEVNEIIGATVEVAKHSELHKFVVISKRCGNYKPMLKAGYGIIILEIDISKITNLDANIYTWLHS